MYTRYVKNITLSAQDVLLHEARKKAVQENTTLNNLFREWLEQYVQRQRTEHEFDQLMKRLTYVKLDRKYTRAEMNER